jgi:Ca-activated chloride channel family protein
MDFNLMEFEFLRPELLWLYIPACILIALILFQKQKHKGSQTVIASHLAQFIMSDAKKQTKPSSIWLMLFLLIGVLAAAGPSWQKHSVPVYQAKHARVLVMDMSSSMFSTDIKPNRLSQARFKTLDMVELFKEGETALIAYAGSAFTISPLTSDAQTLTNLIPSLSPEIMPEKGSNVLAALVLAKELLQQAGYLNGDIILVTDGIDSEDMSDVSDFIADMDYKLNIYAVATEQGAPIKLPQAGFLKDQYGQIVIPKANFSALNNITKQGSGLFSNYQTDNSDIAIFNSTLSADDLQKQLVEQEEQTLWRIDGGIYLTLLLFPIALLMLRQNSALFILPLVLISMPSKNVYALSFDDVWQSISKNQDQKALNAYKNQDYKSATDTDLKDIKGAAHYKESNFEAALSEFEQDTSDKGLYNQGNALAHLGKYKEAIDKYEQALSLNPDFSQAKDNLEIVKQLEQQQQQKQQGDDKNQDGDQSKKDDQQSEGDKSEQNKDQQGDKQEDQKNGENQDQQSSDEQESDKNSDDSQESSADKKGSEQQNKPELDKQTQEPKEQETQPSEEEKQAQQQAQQAAQQTAQEQAEKTKEEMAMREVAELSNEEKEKAQQLNQILRKVPDDPATLLRNKMRLEYQNRLRQRTPQGVQKSW